jgi:AraC family transcriptional regulator of arabinose operon
MPNARDTWVPQLNRLLADRLVRSLVGSARPRGLPYWHLMLITDGLLDFGAQPPHRRFAPGDLILTNPQTALFYRPAQPHRRWSCHYALFTPWPHWTEWLDWPETLPGVRWLRLPGAPALATVRTLFDEVVTHGHARYREEFLGLNALERLLLAAATWNPQRTQHAPDQHVQTAQQYLLDNSGRMVAVAEAAQAAGLSSSRLAHLFRAETGLTPMQFLDRQRLQRACQLLAGTPLPVKDIATQVGYGDIYHFSQRFKKLVGQSPRTYRQRHAG